MVAVLKGGTGGFRLLDSWSFTGLLSCYHLYFKSRPPSGKSMESKILSPQFIRHSCEFGDVIKALHNGHKLLPLSNMVLEFIVHSSRKFNKCSCFDSDLNLETEFIVLMLYLSY